MCNSMSKPKAHDSTAKNRGKKTDYEKPEGRHPVTEPPTQKNNETVQTQPCNLNICLCKKKPQTPRIYKSSSLSMMRGSKPGECSRRFLALTWRRCRQQQRQQRRQRWQQELQRWQRRWWRQQKLQCGRCMCRRQQKLQRRRRRQQPYVPSSSNG